MWDEDDLTGYLLCPHIWEWATKRLQLQRPVGEQAQKDLFLCLNAAWTAQDTTQLLRQVALVDAAYRAHNCWRVRTASGDAPQGLLRQSFSEAVKGHSGATRAADIDI